MNGRNSNEATKRILIVGGGYVGYFAYRSLMRVVGNQVRSGGVTITVVDPLASHSFHGFSGETVGGIISEDARRSPFRSLFRHAEFIRGYATNVDEFAQQVRVRSLDGQVEQTLDFDHLILGVGVGDDLDGLPGLRQHGVTLRAGGGPEGLRRTVIDRLEAATWERDAERRSELLNFVIAGGGFTGVEITAAIAELLDVLRKDYPVLDEVQPRISLVHAGDRLLPDLEGYDRLRNYATKRLLDYGVSIRCGMRVAEITSEGARLDNGSILPSRTVISTIGTSVRAIPGGEMWARDRSGRLLSDDYLHLDGSETIWIGGDGAHVAGRDGQPNCPNALWAIKHGEAIGRNIGRELTGCELIPFSYPGLGQAASLGIGKGIVEFKGIQFTGLLAWVMRIGFFLYFLPSRRTALRALGEWISLPVTGRRTDVSKGYGTTGRTTPPLPSFASIGSGFEGRN